MSEQYGSSNPTPDPSRRGQRRSRRGWIIAGTLAGVLALGVAVATTEYGGGWHHGGRMSAEAFSEHLDYHVKQILSEVDATPEQEAQVTTILQAAASDLYAMKAQHKAAHEELHAILSAPTIDRARLETVRADQLRLVDDASQRIVQSIADAAEILTPEQRTALIARMDRHHRWRED